MQTNETKAHIIHPQGPMPRGIDDFAEAVIQRCCLVDKTPFIEQLLHGNDKVTLITRPRRFGKTINMSMLRYFFERPTGDNEGTEGLFENTFISQNSTSMQHQGKHPVISLTLKSAKLSAWEEAYDELCTLIRREIERHAESEDFTIAGFVEDEQESWHRLLNRTEATQNDWSHSLQLLCKLLTLHHNKDNRNPLTWTKPIVLIDEYDAPIHAAYTHSVERGESLKDESSYYRRMTSFIRSLFGNALKGNLCLYKAVLTGILRVAKEEIFSGLNNPGVYGVLNHRFSSFFGFTETEMRQLFDARGLTKHQQQEIQQWYNGYCFARETIYNPWSVISYLGNLDDKAQTYWVNTSDNALIHTLLRRADADAKNELLQLLSGTSKHVVRPILDDAPLRTLTGTPDELWGLLLASGYATCDKSGYDSTKPSDNTAHLRLPNLEVTNLYRQLVRQWFAQEPRKQQTAEMVKALLVGNGEVFTQRLQVFVRTSMSYFDVSGDDPERVYQAFVLGLLVHLERDYRLRSEREAGDGRADVLLIPKQPNQPGMILEFKLAASVWGEKDQTVVEQGLQETAEAALQQIKEKNYVSEFADQNCRFVLAVGISFVGKQLATAHERLA